MSKSSKKIAKKAARRADRKLPVHGEESEPVLTEASQERTERQAELAKALVGNNPTEIITDGLDD